MERLGNVLIHPWNCTVKMWGNNSTGLKKIILSITGLAALALALLGVSFKKIGSLCPHSVPQPLQHRAAPKDPLFPPTSFTPPLGLHPSTGWTAQQKAAMKIEGPTCLLVHNHLNPYLMYLEQIYPNFFAHIGGGMPSHESITPLVLSCMENEAKGKKNLAFPLSTSAHNHAMLLLIDSSLRTIEFYNSLGTSDDHEACLQTLETLAEKLTELNPGDKKYTVISKIESCIQEDGYQCIVWLLCFLENRLYNQKVNFNLLSLQEASQKIQSFRKHVNKVIPYYCELVLV